MDQWNLQTQLAEAHEHLEKAVAEGRPVAAREWAEAISAIRAAMRAESGAAYRAGRVT